MENKSIKILTLLLLNIICLCAFSQKYKCDYEVISDNAILIKAVYNNDKEHFIRVYIDGANDNAFCGTVGANSSLSISKNCSKYVKAEVQGGGTEVILDAKRILQERKALREKNQTENAEQTASQESAPSKQNGDDKVDDSKRAVKKASTSSVETSDVLNAFTSYTDTIAYYSDSYYNNLNSDVNRFVDAIKYMDQKNKEKYVSDNQLNGYLTDAKNNLKEHQDNTDEFIEDFLNKYYSGVTVNDKQRCLDEMHIMLSSKLKEREDAIAVLENAITGGSVTALFDKILGDKSMLMNIGIAFLLLTIILLIVINVRQRKKAKTPTVFPADTTQQNTQADIVVRRKTTSILKKQSLEDVHNNSAYMKIDCADFCEDSAVRRIYFKNTCIKDIY